MNIPLSVVILGILGMENTHFWPKESKKLPIKAKASAGVLSFKTKEWPWIRISLVHSDFKRPAIRRQALAFAAI